MKTIKYILAIMMVFWGTTSCEFGDTNIDPTRPSDAPLNLILPSVQAQIAFNVGANTGRIPGLVMQYFEGFDAQQIAYYNYNITEIDMNNYWRTGFYAALLNNAQVVIDKADAEGNPYYSGIAKIISAHGLGMTTALFGDIPYSEAIQGSANLKPSYDTQEQIFASIQSLLDDAISDLSATAYIDPAPPSSDDLIFGGDTDKWIATARALKARYFMHLTLRDANASSSALTQLNSAFDSVDDEPIYPFETAQNGANPYFLFGQQRPKTLITATNFIDYLDNNSDPRAEFIYTVDAAGDGIYYDPLGNAPLYWSQANTEMPLISLEEVKFLEAEALLRTSASDAAVLGAMEEGVRANMTRLGVSAADIDTYVTNRVNFTGLTTTETKLERLMEEKYVCLYGPGHIEAWTDYRRTGYPALTPVDSDGSGLNPGRQIPRRFIYPISERQTNEANVEAAKTRQGGDLMNVDLWAYDPS